MKSTLSKYKDIDLLILEKLNDKDLLVICQVNKYMKDLCNDNNFWRNRFETKFGKDIAQKPINKEYYFEVLKFANNYKKLNPIDKLTRFMDAITMKRLDLLKVIDDKNRINENIANIYPLDYAIYVGNLNIVKYLIKNGAKMGLGVKNFLKEASALNKLNIVKYLVEEHGDKNQIGVAAIEVAIERGYFDIVKYLIEKGGDIHLLDDKVIRLATTWGNLDMVKWLVERGADYHVLNDRPLKIARKKGYTEIVKYLESLP